MIRSLKGPGGGFYLDSGDISTPLSEAVKAIDGESLFSSIINPSETSPYTYFT
ncbi:hypothetical protein [Sphingobacterium sp.]|uniref:hypothetical protein n=1 Tax=Sphingobacterium sp. TaxID=341027 RepID=UPI002FDDBD19